MFDPSGQPRLFALAPGIDFPRALAAGFWRRTAGMPPEAVARVQIYVNTRRMQRRLQLMMADGRAALLPQIRLITDLGTDTAMRGIAPSVPPLRRRLELAQLISALLDREPDLAPRSSIHDLADSLARLMDEMQGEAVPPERIAALDVSNHSGHWERSLAFIRIVGQFFGEGHAPDAEARQRLVVNRLTQMWQASPPDHPVIIAGSTGSRGATQALMQAVAKLPQGAIVLPGFDFDLPGAVWQAMTDALTAEDHPQFRFRRLMTRLGVALEAVLPWDPAEAPSPARNRLISLSLRPAPVTDQWMTEGAALTDIAEATSGLTLIEAASPRQEAMAIALRLRKAAEDGVTAALITPDRGLTRQVTAALDRWGILPDDSAGKPLALSAPGRLLRQVSALYGRKLTAEALLALLKHPLVATGSDRGDHLRWTRDLELKLRRDGPQFPTGPDLIAWARARPGEAAWAEWLARSLAGTAQVGTLPLTDHVAAHRAHAEGLAAGPAGNGSGQLWLENAGVEARKEMEDLHREAGHGGAMSAAEYDALFRGVLQQGVVRDAPRAHSGIMIWGTLEARVQGADLVILGGLNDGIWPAAPPPDPWLNRQMRHDAGLLLPERQVGLSAHDYQQAVAARDVVLTRATRNAEAETVASRWLNRLMNLLDGLPDQGGRAALAAMRARGQVWLGLAARADLPDSPVQPEKRPAPRPPVSARPRELYVTQISRLIRDPYAVYARQILRLKPLDPLRQLPDAQERGMVFHRVLEQFIRQWDAEPPDQARMLLLGVADDVMTTDIPWPEARRLWRARLERVADWFVAQEALRPGIAALIEKTGSVALDRTGVTLSARPDRIDVLEDGSLHILDYKTGTPPSKPAQEHFDKQLLLEAAMAERGAFHEVGAQTVRTITYIGLGSTPREEQTRMDAGQADAAWAELIRLIARYNTRAQGYASRRAVQGVRFEGDYDHLARYGEWEASDAPVPVDVGPEDPQ